MRARLLVLLLLIGLLPVPAVAQVTGPPYTFVNGDVIDADQVNLNFTTVYTHAVDRLAAVIGGHMTWSPDNTYDIGASGTTRPRDFFLGRNAVVGGTLQINGASTFNGSTVFGGTSNTFNGATSFAASVTVSATTILPSAVFGPGSISFSAAPQVSMATPLVSLDEIDQSANERLWAWVVDSKSMMLTAYNSAFAGGSNAITVARGVGSAITSITLGGTSLVVPDSVRFTSGATSGFTYAAGNLNVVENNVTVTSFDSTGVTMLVNFQLATQSFAGLGTPSNGTMVYCTDCTIMNPCASGGLGAVAKRINSTWICN